MKNKSYLLNMVLTAGLGALLLACVLVKTFLPGVILPELDIPGITLISLTVLFLEHFFVPGAGRNYFLIFLFSAISFALLPVASGMAGAGEWWRLALAGGLIFTGTTWIFESVSCRIASGNGSKTALILTALGIYLAVQCFTGIFL